MKNNLFSKIPLHLPKFESDYFNRPRFSIRPIKELDEDFTYRKINDWENKKLISPYRETKETGWRLFSFIDMIKLFIITDLKKFGFSNQNIEKILREVSFYDVGQKGVDPFEALIKLYTLRIRCVLIILNNEKIRLLSDEHRQAENGIFDEVFSEICNSTSVVLSSTKYIKKISKMLTAESISQMDSEWPNWKEYIEKEKEQTIISLIRNQEYQEITYVKKDGGKFKITAKSRKSGKFSDKEIINKINENAFQRVTVLTQDGERVELIREETIKV